MLVYWILFAYFAAGAVLGGERGDARKMAAPSMFWAGVAIIAVLIGFRFEVGGDWFAYVRMFQRAHYIDFAQSLSAGDPAYQALNWIVAQLGLGLWMVDLVCGSIFAIGLASLARLQPNPWLAVLVAIPYIVIVVAMGYTRQGVAIGVLMLGFASLSFNGSLPRFVVYVLIATLFHKTALIVLPIAAFGSGRNRLVNSALILLLTYFLYSSFLSTSIDKFMRNYVEAEYNSEGAAIRVVMNLVPALIYFISTPLLKFNSIETRLWRNLSVVAMVTPVLLWVSPSSTVVDRLSLYVTSLQIVILSRPAAFRFSNRFGTLLVILYCLAVQFVWLNYAKHADDWVPYRFFPIGHAISAPRG